MVQADWAAPAVRAARADRAVKVAEDQTASRLSAEGCLGLEVVAPAVLVASVVLGVTGRAVTVVRPLAFTATKASSILMG